MDLPFTDFYFCFTSVFKYFLLLRVTEWIRLEGTTVVIWFHLPAQAGSSQSTWHRVVSRQFWNISSEGDSTLSLGNLCQCPITAQEKGSSSCSDALLCINPTNTENDLEKCLPGLNTPCDLNGIFAFTSLSNTKLS